MLDFKDRIKKFLGLDLYYYEGRRSPVDELRLQYIVFSCRLGLFICLVMMLIAFVHSGFTLDVFMGAYWAAILGLTPWLLRKGISIEAATRFQAISFLIFIVCLLSRELNLSSGRLYWAYIFPPITFFVNGKKEAVIGSLILMIILFGLLNGYFVDVSFPFRHQVRFFITFGMVVAACFGVEYCRDVAMEKMYDIQNSYSDKVNQLIASEDALKSIQKKAIESAKLATLGEMAGGIAHEINNPLTVISGNARLIKKRLSAKDANPIDVIKYADRIMGTVERLELIVRGLKSFIRSGPDDPYELVSLNKIIKESLSLAMEKITFSQVSFEVDEISEDVLINCRETEISQVFLNLLDNALDAVKGLDKPWIRILYNATEARHILTIADNGSGMSKEIREHIFKPFFTTKKVGKGTGLGLSITRDIIERHGGTIYVSDGLDCTRMIIELPRV